MWCPSCSSLEVKKGAEGWITCECGAKWKEYGEDEPLMELKEGLLITRTDPPQFTPIP